MKYPSLNGELNLFIKHMQHYEVTVYHIYNIDIIYVVI
jgi:hypothetical protein